MLQKILAAFNKQIRLIKQRKADRMQQQQQQSQLKIQDSNAKDSTAEELTIGSKARQLEMDSPTSSPPHNSKHVLSDTLVTRTASSDTVAEDSNITNTASHDISDGGKCLDTNERGSSTTIGMACVLAQEVPNGNDTTLENLSKNSCSGVIKVSSEASISSSNATECTTSNVLETGEGLLSDTIDTLDGSINITMTDEDEELANPCPSDVDSASTNQQTHSKEAAIKKLKSTNDSSFAGFAGDTSIATHMLPHVTKADANISKSDFETGEFEFTSPCISKQSDLNEPKVNVSDVIDKSGTNECLSVSTSDIADNVHKTTDSSAEEVTQCSESNNAEISNEDKVEPSSLKRQSVDDSVEPKKLPAIEFKNITSLDEKLCSSEDATSDISDKSNNTPQSVTCGVTTIKNNEANVSSQDTSDNPILTTAVTKVKEDTSSALPSAAVLSSDALPAPLRRLATNLTVTMTPDTQAIIADTLSDSSKTTRAKRSITMARRSLASAGGDVTPGTTATTTAPATVVTATTTHAVTPQPVNPLQQSNRPKSDETDGKKQTLISDNAVKSGNNDTGNSAETICKESDQSIEPIVTIGTIAVDNSESSQDTESSLMDCLISTRTSLTIATVGATTSTSTQNSPVTTPAESIADIRLNGSANSPSVRSKQVTDQIAPNENDVIVRNSNIKKSIKTDVSQHTGLSDSANDKAKKSVSSHEAVNSPNPSSKKYHRSRYDSKILAAGSLFFSPEDLAKGVSTRRAKSRTALAENAPIPKDPSKSSMAAPSANTSQIKNVKLMTPPAADNTILKTVPFDSDQILGASATNSRVTRNKSSANVLLKSPVAITNGRPTPISTLHSAIHKVDTPGHLNSVTSHAKIQSKQNPQNKNRVETPSTIPVSTFSNISNVSTPSITNVEVASADQGQSSRKRLRSSSKNSPSQNANTPKRALDARNDVSPMPQAVDKIPESKNLAASERRSSSSGSRRISALVSGALEVEAQSPGVMDEIHLRMREVQKLVKKLDEYHDTVPPATTPTKDSSNDSTAVGGNQYSASKRSRNEGRKQLLQQSPDRVKVVDKTAFKLKHRSSQTPAQLQKAPPADNTVMHLPTRKIVPSPDEATGNPIYQRCVECLRNGVYNVTSSVFCDTCDVALCVIPCFRAYHLLGRRQ